MCCVVPVTLVWDVRPVTRSHRLDKYYTDSSHVELNPAPTSSSQCPVSLNTLYASLTITSVTGQDRLPRNQAHFCDVAFNCHLEHNYCGREFSLTWNGMSVVCKQMQDSDQETLHFKGEVIFLKSNSDERIAELLMWKQGSLCPVCISLWVSVLLSWVISFIKLL